MAGGAPISGPEPITADELRAFEEAGRRAFHDEGHPADVELDMRTTEPERALVVRAGGQIVGTTAALTQRITVPGGGVVPVAAVCAVGVVPGHTRQGHLTRLMRRQLDDIRAGGEPLAVLYASEGAIYGRFGYGLSTRATTFELQLPGARVRPSAPRPARRARQLDVTDALPAMRAVYDTVRTGQPGMLERTDIWWERRTYDPEHRRGGIGVLRAVVQDGDDGEPAGYAMYHAKSDWDELGPSGKVTLRELIAATPEARAGLWDYLTSLGLMRTLRWVRAPDHDPLPVLLQNADGLTNRVGWGLWARVVDARAALAARGYAAPLDVVLELDDAFLPANAGRHRLTWDGDAATCEPTDAPADLALDAEALGAAYLGGTPLETLAAAGRVRELRPGALTAAAAAFRSVPPPFCSDAF
jgi:predicted acetyltransferase